MPTNTPAGVSTKPLEVKPIIEPPQVIATTLNTLPKENMLIPTFDLSIVAEQTAVTHLKNFPQISLALDEYCQCCIFKSTCGSEEEKHQYAIPAKVCATQYSKQTVWVGCENKDLAIFNEHPYSESYKQDLHWC